MKGAGKPIEIVSRRESQRLRELDTDYQPVNWKRLFLAPKYLVCWILAIVALVLTVIITVRHDQVVAYLRPWSEKVRDLPAGWLIPIAILIAISFPPLFGHEIIALLCGVVYGLWIGFGIVAAGTFLGELGTWFAFRYLFRRKAEKLERTNLNYGALARLTRDGGFWIVLVIRFSAIPSHFSTAVFSTCGVRFWPFAIATLLTLPKQIFLVYLGVLLLQDSPDHSAKTIVFAIAFAVTIVMAVYIWRRMNNIKKVLLEEQAERRKARVHNVSVDGEVEGRPWPTETQQQPRGERDYEVVAQEEVDIGMVGSRSDTLPAAHLGPQYRADFEYQGRRDQDHVGREPVREQVWV
ncbi:snare associated Golgi protein-domain-containing protein [Chaetomidium leptoderma]|uniref:Golgi apparatus membrane protein TVP38 n=1 Tax=Chaetomidium leptoderma TaxID=669021 RepID=A0AAN6ZSW5_9PEZI|nr:snare associated Golgi protein-domain-containing protein [Chaetomidium leptoderma]